MFTWAFTSIQTDNQDLNYKLKYAHQKLKEEDKALCASQLTQTQKSDNKRTEYAAVVKQAQETTNAPIAMHKQETL